MSISFIIKLLSFSHCFSARGASSSTRFSCFVDLPTHDSAQQQTNTSSSNNRNRNNFIKVMNALMLFWCEVWRVRLEAESVCIWLQRTQHKVHDYFNKLLLWMVVGDLLLRVLEMHKNLIDLFTKLPQHVTWWIRVEIAQCKDAKLAKMFFLSPLWLIGISSRWEFHETQSHNDDDDAEFCTHGEE